MQSIDRWRSWTPGGSKNLGKDHKMELTKLTKQPPTYRPAQVAGIGRGRTGV